MSTITTHILDTSTGRPAEGVIVTLYTADAGNEPKPIAQGHTNKDGRIMEWPATGAPGVYKIRFETKAYFDRHTIPTFYPFVEIDFEMKDEGHYHIPLLISPFGYSTYRGS